MQQLLPIQGEHLENTCSARSNFTNSLQIIADHDNIAHGVVRRYSHESGPVYGFRSRKDIQRDKTGESVDREPCGEDFKMAAINLFKTKELEVITFPTIGYKIL